MVSKRSSYIWYPKDYISDPVYNCSLAAQGLWRAMIDMMFLSEPQGYLEKNGKPLPDETIAQYCRCKTVEDYRALLAELRTVGIPTRDTRGVIYSKRLLEVLEEREGWMQRKRRQRANESEPQSPNNHPPAGFDAFYSAYPNKPGPAAARKCWTKIKADEVPAIMVSVERHKATEAWQKENGKYIPLPSTFLNQRRWEAEIKANAETDDEDPHRWDHLEFKGWPDDPRKKDPGK
jgi:hypothetical protein